MIQESIQTPFTVQDRARATHGKSHAAIYELVARVIGERYPGGGLLLDIGCGTGELWRFTNDRFSRYVGVDVVRYDGFPETGTFQQIDLDTQGVLRPEGGADVVTAVETIEHVENPRAFVRELTRLAKPGGLIIVTTPNQLSLLNKFAFVVKNQFVAFQEAPGLYPAHLTALLEIDLMRIARECGLAQAAIHYTDSGRMPGVSWHWPRGLRGRAFSDNLLLEARRPLM